MDPIGDLVVESPHEHLGGWILTVKEEDTLADGPKTLELRVLGVEGHGVVEAIQTHHGSDPFTVMQWLGMQPTACNVDVQLSHGVPGRPDQASDLATLKAEIEAAATSWGVGWTGPGGCAVDEASNVQGRLLNGVAADQVCATAASTASEHYIAVLQAPGFRRAADWITAVQATWP